jgi:hypothetical protein
MLWLNCFRDGDALVETEPQGDASYPLHLPDSGILAELLTTPEVSAALARLFLAGVTAGERAARTTRIGPPSA